MEHSRGARIPGWSLFWLKCPFFPVSGHVRPAGIYIDMVTDTGGIEIGDGWEFGYVDMILAYNVLHGPPDPPDSSAGDTEDATAKERKAMLAAMLCRKRLRPLCRWEDLWQRDVQGGGPLVPCVGGPLLTPPGFTSGANTQTGGFQRFGTLQGPKVPGAKLTVGMVTSRFLYSLYSMLPVWRCRWASERRDSLALDWSWRSQCWRESRVSISSQLGSRVWSVAL
jgi:hypothetical protein